MNKAIFFSSLIPKEYKEYYKENSIGAVSNANNSLQWALVEGFKLNGYQMDLINFPNIGAYPTKFKKIYTKSFSFTNGGILTGKNIGVLNLNFVKHLLLYQKLKTIVKNNRYFKDHNLLLIYDVYPPFLKILNKIKKKNPAIKIVLIVPDIHGFTAGNDSVFRKVIQFFDQKIINKNLINVDAFVLLTASMLEKLPEFVKNNKPFTIMEGILNTESIIVEKSIGTKPNLKKIILYTGSLDIRHGILNLINAFLMANIQNSELHICGDGDGAKEIVKSIINNKSIHYLGQLSREDAVRKQQESFLLVNPRTSEGEFTKYSFPSKVIEYLSSGTPTFMYKLEGIPNEYYDFCYFREDESVEALSLALIEILGEDPKILSDKASLAKSFILSQKNPLKQVEKIINLIK